MVRISPSIVPGVVDETLADITDVLFASVESDMDAARATFRTVPGDENIAGIAEAQRTGVVRPGLNRLVEAHHRSCELTSIGWVQRTVNVLQDDSSLVITALVNIRDVVVFAVVEATDLRLLQDDQ